MTAHTPTATSLSAPSSGAAASQVQRERVGVAWRAVALILLVKAIVFAAVWFGYQRVDLASDVYQENTPYHEPADYGFLTRLTTWDASHYLRLAQDGYTSEAGPSNAFAPLLPLLIRSVSWLTGDPLIAGLLVANAASAAACYLLFAFARRRWGEATAWRALVLLLAFPTAFFLSLVYTESVFLLLAVAVFYCLDRATADGRPSIRWLALAALAAFLMPLTRPIGIAVALPLAVWAVTSFRHQATSAHRPSPNLLPVTGYLLLVAAPLAGALAHLAYMQAATGDALAHVHAQALFGAQWEAANLLRPWVFAHELFGRGLSLHGHLNSALDRLFFLGFLAFAPLVYRRAGLPLFLLYAALGLLPPLMGSFMAYTRLLVPAFPLYIAWAACLQSHPLATRNAVALMAVMQLAALLAHTSSRWVA